ncbi:MAG: DUF434 domain-containing protein [Sedimentisphaerales bacterium]|nr:DUF434 domain-containing protein [Sedimentisphaerales bacterium]
MPDKRTHRGPHPEDSKLFASEALGDLRLASADYAMLLTKGYAPKSSLKLVGDRFALTERQRLALMRCACSDGQLHARDSRRISIDDLAGSRIVIDGYNLLITVEAAISGGIILKGRDRCCRDLAGIHGTYRKVTETVPALELIGSFLKEIDPAEVTWLLDKPVSNSGRLRKIMADLAKENPWPWQVELVLSPDAVLRKADSVVVTTDSAVLDLCGRWSSLASEIIAAKIPDAWIIDLAHKPMNLREHGRKRS